MERTIKRTQRLRVSISVSAIFLALVYIFAWSPLLTVQSISVSGLPKGVESQSIISRAGVYKGEKLARIEPRSVSKSLQELDWIQSTDVSRDWLKGAISIALHPRQAIGIFRGKAVDATGRLFLYPSTLSSGLPTVNAPSTETALLGISIYNQMPAALASNLLSLTVRSESSISSRHRISAARELLIIWGDAKDVPLKMKVLQALLLLPENKEIKKADLSAPHAPIVK